MIFQSPNVLWALGLLAIPIIIHLFQFKRYKQLYFSDVSLLKEVQSRSQTKNQLKHLLVLFTRMALIAFAVLAFARPFIPASSQNIDNKKRVSIYIDNSFSMQNASENGSLFNESLQRAFQVAESYPSETEFQIITNDLAPFQKRFLDFDAFVEALDQLSISANQANGQRLLDFHASTLRENELSSGLLYMISDFSQVFPQNIQADSIQELRLLQLKGKNVSNASIDSVWLETPVLTKGTQERLNIRLTNHGDELKTDIEVEIELEGQIVSNLILTLEPNASIDTSIQLQLNQSGFLKGRVKLADKPVIYDNEYYFTLAVRSDISIVEISGDNGRSKPFKKLFDVDGESKYAQMTEGNILLDTAAAADFIILNEVENYSTGLLAMLSAKLGEGKNVLMVLPQTLEKSQQSPLASEFGIELSTYDTSKLPVVTISLDDELYTSVFADRPENLNLPKAGAHWVTSESGGQASLMNFITGNAFLARFQKGKGSLFVLTSPLSAKGNTFAEHALFVPTLYNAALLSGFTQKVSDKVGDIKVHLPAIQLSENLKMIAKDSFSFIPSVAYDGLFIGDQVKQNGHFDLMNENKKVASYAFNYYNSESNVSAINKEEIATILSENSINFTFIEANGDQLRDQISKADLGEELWVWAVALALLFLLIESILIKVFNR